MAGAPGPSTDRMFVHSFAQSNKPILLVFFFEHHSKTQTKVVCCHWWFPEIGRLHYKLTWCRLMRFVLHQHADGDLQHLINSNLIVSRCSPSLWLHLSSQRRISICKNVAEQWQIDQPERKNEENNECTVKRVRKYCFIFVLPTVAWQIELGCFWLELIVLHIYSVITFLLPLYLMPLNVWLKSFF